MAQPAPRSASNFLTPERDIIAQAQRESIRINTHTHTTGYSQSSHAVKHRNSSSHIFTPHTKCLFSSAAAPSSHPSRRSQLQRPRSIWCLTCTAGMRSNSQLRCRCSALPIDIPPANSNANTTPQTHLCYHACVQLSIRADKRNHSLLKSCSAKCVDTAYREADLNKGESVCLDRCVSKFFEVNVKVSEKMQGEAQGKQGFPGGM